jgi:hypothetical protein
LRHHSANRGAKSAICDARSHNELFARPVAAVASWTTGRLGCGKPKHAAALAATIRGAIELIQNRPASTGAIDRRDFSPPAAEDAASFTLPPENDVNIAESVTCNGVLRQKSADWKDFFFFEHDGDNGS